MLEKTLTTFNSFFQGKAEAKIVGDRLEITIGSQTLIISLPEVIGDKTSVYVYAYLKGTMTNP